MGTVLQTVHVGAKCIEGYELSAGAAAVMELRALSRPLQGARVLHINATPYGGGVAEILRSEIPLLRDLGLRADWRIVVGDEPFFRVTKTIHNGLQGATQDLTAADQRLYIDGAAANAGLMEGDYDLVVVHDPQPLPLLHFRGRGSARWIWRCHIDTSEPNPHIWQFLRPFLQGYDAAVFTLDSFVPPDLGGLKVKIIPPAIDPESPKNVNIGIDIARRVLQWIGIDVDRPLIAQISRFDPWKDPMGVISAYQMVRQEIPGLQLALVGSMALDDPEGWDIYRTVQSAGAQDPDLHVFTNLTGVGNVEVNAFQQLADVVIQKSIREGFGLVVSEALWKGTPVVAGRAGGIPLQLPDETGGFLVDSVADCAARVLWLLQHPDEARHLGALGRERVRKQFLLTRLMADELRLYAALLGEKPVRPEPEGAEQPAEGARDPVCGMIVNPDKSLIGVHGDHVYHFCSAACERMFRTQPERFLRCVHPWRPQEPWQERKG